jgi:hypothetical protein
MIVTELYEGQGIGNQLWCYVTTRAIAKKRGFDFGIIHPEKFKGLDFMDLDFGKPVLGGKNFEGGPPKKLPEGITHYYRESESRHPMTGADIRLHDNDLMNVPDNTQIDGIMQDEQYIIEYKDEIRNWLKTKDLDVSVYTGNNTCIMNIRGGEYTHHPELYLNKKYWTDAMKNMLGVNPNLNFIIISEDPESANKMFPDIPAYDFGIGMDYCVLAKAKYVIMSNTSFAWFPTWLNQDLQYCIAPKYWARHNVSDGYWSTGYNLYMGYMYQDRDGKLFDYTECLKEFQDYIKSHPSYYTQPKGADKYTFVPNTDLRQFMRKIRFYFGKLL